MYGPSEGQERRAAKVARTPDGVAYVTVTIRNAKTGTSASWDSFRATGEMPAAKALVKRLETELSGRSAATRSRIRAEKAAS